MVDLGNIYTPIIQELAERQLLYITEDRGPAETLNAAKLAGLAEPQVLAILMLWTHVGQRDGHEWFACDTCGELRLMRVKRGRPCTTNTPLLPRRCRGHMARIAARPRMTKALEEML